MFDSFTTFFCGLMTGVALSCIVIHVYAKASDATAVYEDGWADHVQSMIEDDAEFYEVQQLRSHYKYN